MPSTAVRSNVQVKLALHANEPNPPADTSMGFFLATDDQGRPLYSVSDTSPSSVLSRIASKGYAVDPRNNEVIFEKSAWDGPAGLYEDRPGSRSPAFGVNIDFRRPKPIIGMREYAVGRPGLSAVSGIVFTAADNSINDATGRLAVFTVGDVVVTSGTANNNFLGKTVSTSSATKLVLDGGGVVDESPATCTILGRPFAGLIVGAATFLGVLYIVVADAEAPASAYVFKLSNWTLAAPGSAYWLYVWKHTTAGTPEQLYVHNSILYLAMGTVAYAYTTDGSTWVVSTRTGNDAKAHRFLELNGYLHKLLKPNEHQQMPNKTDTGINGGTAWNSADLIGDSTNNVMEMLGLVGSIIFCREDGIFTMDSGGNIRPLTPDLFYQLANGLRSEVWHQKIFYPMINSGHLWAMVGGSPSMVTPGLQQERPMEIIGSELSSFVAPVNAMLRTPQYLFASLDLGTTIRIMSLEETNQGMIWRTQMEGGLVSNDFLWLTTTPTTRPVIWANSAYADNVAACWILPLGPDPVQDASARFAPSGVIYEPWLCPDPETNMRWGWLELVFSEKTLGSGVVTLTVNAYTEAGNTIMNTGIVSFVTTGPTRVSIAFTNANVSRCTSRRMRLTFTLATSNGSHTPILLSYKVHAYAIPTSRRIFEMSVLLPVSGVGRGLFRQNQARTFLNFLRAATLPITFTDPFGSSPWTVHRASAQLQEAAINAKGQLIGEIWRLALMEEVTT